MRFIMEIQLNNDTIMSVIANGKNKEDVKKWAVQSSIRLFGDSAMHVHKEDKIISVDRWSQDKQSSYKNGSTQYIVAFFMDNITQFIRIEAAGVKSAYNSVKVKYGIQENLNMMIYEVNQDIKKRKTSENKEETKNKLNKDRKSSVEAAKEIIKDTSKVDYVLNKAYEKTKGIPVLNIYAPDIYMMLSLVVDYCSGRYEMASINTIIGIVSCALYFLNSKEILPDISPEIKEYDDVTVFAWAIRQSRDDIMQYSKWLCYKEQYSRAE